MTNASTTTAIDTREPGPAPPLPPSVKVVCSNCGAELLGDYCFSCGQPVKGMIRPLSSMLHDVADTIFNIDSRIFRTLWPLLIRPGYLSNEYFAGRRVRFVTPFRLYFFLSIAAFFAIQLWLGAMNLGGLTFDVEGGQNTNFSSALTKEEVTARRDAVLAGLESAKAATSVSPRAAAKIEKSEDKVRDKAAQRIKYLQSVEDAEAKGQPVPAESSTSSDEGHVELFGQEWNEKTHPVHIGWLPEFVNERLNSAIGRMRGNATKIESDPKPFVIGIFGVLPQVLFVVMPLFALLLKLFYIFKRRLYMEHLIIALHSHSFIFFALLLITGLSALHGWAETAAPWLSATLGVGIFVLSWWIPIYLFVMQKKVYKQGWIMTTLKFGVIGICYTIIISFGVAAAFLVSLATT